MQVIKYKWENWEPFLSCRDDNNVFSKIRLMQSELCLRIGEKRCIGFFSEGKYRKCPNNTRTEYSWHCNSCRLEDDFFTCIQCDGSNCINDSRRSECAKERYYIYLAAFDSVLKVGVSQGYRLLERLVEQGADFGARIAEVTDGKNVRVMEQEIKNYLGITDRMKGSEKQKMIFCNPNKAAVNILNATKKLSRNGFSLGRIEIYDLRKYYNLQNVIAGPQKSDIKDGTKLSGRVVAAKGNILILRKGYDFFSANAHDLIGRDIYIDNHKGPITE